MKLIIFFLRVIRKVSMSTNDIFTKTFSDSYKAQLYESYITSFGKNANNLIFNLLKSGSPCMISKFGTVELSALVSYKSIQQSKYTKKDFYEFFSGKRDTLWWKNGIDLLYRNAGFFPNDESLLGRFYELNVSAVCEIDVLGSYKYEEKFFDNELSNALRVNLDGYYAPFFYDNPWTSALEGKKVLVIHPFETSIVNQYKQKDKIWKDKKVLPDFKLITLKAVQTIAGEDSTFKDWFEALESMKNQINAIDFDIAIIGCGAYGMPLAAHVKKMGKQAIHMAGWTQILFGIKGKRWVDMPSVAQYMNKYWSSPLSSEIPRKFKKVEDGCYW